MWPNPQFPTDTVVTAVLSGFAIVEPLITKETNYMKDDYGQFTMKSPLKGS